jgi:hypothetical protein
MAFGGSGRSQKDEKRRSPNWEGAPLTDFVITTVNVPDRLDMQEMRAREEEDDEPTRARRRGLFIDSYSIGLWLRRILVVAVLGTLLFFAYGRLRPIYDGLAAHRIADRLTKSLGQRVTVADSRLELSRSPRLALKGIDVAGQLKIDDVGLLFNYDEAIRAVRGGQWAWGEAQVGPLKLTHDQAMALLEALPKAMAGLPPSVSILRLASVSFPDYPLLPGRYEVVVRRGENGGLASIQMEMLDIEGQMRMKITPRGVGEPVDFSLEALRWKAPIGPASPWSDLVASGQASTNLLMVDRYVGSNFYGATQGQLVAARDIEWAVTGTARAINVNLEQLFRGLRPATSGAEADAFRSPFTGLASMNLVISGSGPTLDKAVDFASITGPLEVRYAQLNGINLGYAATRGASSTGGGGLTRFTELDATIMASGRQVLLTDISGRAGAMATRGEVLINDDLSLIGALRVDLGVTRVLAPINLRVRGSALQPQFTN